MRTTSRFVRATVGGALLAALLVPSAAFASSSEPAAAAPAGQIVIDNDSPGFSRSGFATTSSAGNREHYGADYRHSGAGGTGTQWARWTPDIATGGSYHVFMRWTSFDNRPAAVPVTITSEGGATTTTLTVDQRRSSLNWHHLGVVTLAPGNGNSVALTDAGGPYTTADAVKFVPTGIASAPFDDDFEDEAVGTDPSHWIEDPSRDHWRTVASDGGIAYQHTTRNHDSALSWLHVFEQNVDFSARFRVDDFRPDLAKLRLSVRHNSDDAQIFAGYDLVSQRWHIRERSGADREWVTLAESAVMPLDTAAWHSIRVRAVNSTIELFIDGASVLRTTEASHVSPGRVALAAGGTVARFDDVSLRLLSGQGRVEDGVLDYTLSPEDGVYREGATIVELSNGDLALRHREELFLSTDGGRSFDRQDTHSWPQNAHGHHSIIRLQDGTLLNMVAEYEHPPATGDEPLRFRAYVSDGDGASWEPAGLTWPGFREGLPGRSEVIVMNDKLTQTSTGRIFFAATVREDDGETIVGHRMEVYFSDDGGLNWSRSAGDSDDYASSWPSYGEGKVVETASGALRLYTPYTDAATLRSATSTDGGLTWGGDSAVPGLYNARSSFGVDTDDSGRYFMVWVMNDNAEHATTFLPRSRLALATSTDGVSWTYLMDLDRWVSERDDANRPITQFVDPGITVTDDFIYVTSGRSESLDVEHHNDQRLRVYRVDRSTLTPYPSWPAEY